MRILFFFSFFPIRWGLGRGKNITPVLNINIILSKFTLKHSRKSPINLRHLEILWIVPQCPVPSNSPSLALAMFSILIIFWSSQQLCKVDVLLSAFYRSWNWRWKRLRDLLRVTKLLSTQGRVCTQALLTPSPVVYTLHTLVGQFLL